MEKEPSSGPILGPSIIALSQADLARLSKFDALHTGRSSHVNAWLPSFARATKVSYDLATVHDPKRIEELSPHCFLLALSGGGLSREEALALCHRACAGGARCSLVARGTEGALLISEVGVFEAKAQPVKAVDTLGAGDTFISHVLVGLLNRACPDDILAQAAKEAATTCLTPGAFGHARPMSVDLSKMMTLEEIYRAKRPGNVPEEGGERAADPDSDAAQGSV